ncbi:MAG: PIN domain-containing protein [Cyanobacterium sp.]
MLLIDTSIWIEVLRDKSKVKAERLKKIIAHRNYYLSVFTKMELLQGCKNEVEWEKINTYLAVQKYLIPDYHSIWENSARLYFERPLRQSPISA